MPLTRYKVLSLACYGTLIDRDTGVLTALRPLLAAARLTLPRDDVLTAYARHESEQLASGALGPYARLLAETHRRLAKEWGVICSEEDHQLFGRSVAHWPAYPDVPGALQYLRRFFRLVVLSNADHESIAACRRRLDTRFEAVYTPEDVGSYKPDRRNFEFLVARLARLGASAGNTLHVAASVPHDLEPAAAVGLGTAWLDRQRGSTATAGGEAGTIACDYVFYSTADIVRAHQEQLRA